MPPSPRPLSPHLQVYRPQITSVLSIFHRITGVALCLGTLLLTWWLVSATYGEDAFDRAQSFMGSIFGQLILWGFTFATFYHFANGIRHLAWDFGLGLELSQVRQSGIAMLVFACAATAVTLFAAYFLAGGM